jgi:hypothetical protein
MSLLSRVPIEPSPQLAVDLSAGWVIEPTEAAELAAARAWEDLEGKVLIFERPRADQLYVVSGDVGEGIGQDRSVADVTRVGTLREPDEQVAQFVSSRIDAPDFAYVLDLLGRLYTGADNLPALLAPECNGPGMATLSELQRHIGYDNIFVWQYEDALDPARRLSTKVGWWTTPRTRPYILSRYIKMVRKVDPNSGQPDYKINSPFTVEELRDFQTQGRLYEAEADPSGDAHDDTIMSGAIGLWVVSTVQETTLESTSDARRRKSEEEARRKSEAERQGREYDYRSMEYTAGEMREGWEEPDGFPGGRGSE